MTGAGEAGESSMSATSAVRIQFPEGLRVLAVDDDQTCLHIVGRMLERCMYQVTKCRSGKEALSLLREDSRRFDIVLSDLHLSDINGLKLLEIMAFEMDMPVVVMSSDEKRETIMKGVIHGACEYLVKPVRMDAVELLWQHVIRKRRNDQLKDMEQAMEDELVVEEEGEEGRSMKKKKKKRRKLKKEDQVDEGGESSDHINTAPSTSTSAVKKPRMVWTPSLHQQFEAAVNQLGYSRAVPKKIVEQMNLPGLTRENVASHLQKFRQHRRRQSKISQRRLQGLTMGGASRYSMASVDQTNLLDYGMVGQQPSSYTYGDMDFQISEGINSKFLNLPSANAMMKMDQTPYGLPMLNEISGQGHHLQFGDQFHPFSNQVLSDDIEAQAFRAVGDNSIQGINAATCYPLASSPMVDFSEDHSHGFPLEAAPGMNSIYGNACSVGQEIVSLGEGYKFRNPENSFRINPESFWSLGYKGFSFGEHFQQEFMSQKF